MTKNLHPESVETSYISIEEKQPNITMGNYLTDISQNISITDQQMKNDQYHQPSKKRRLKAQ
jgi:hypothetical protein